MTYLFVGSLVLIISLAVFLKPDNILVFLVLLGCLAAAAYFLETGNQTLAENSAQLFFVAWSVTFLLFHSPRLIHFLRKFFEVGDNG